MGVFKLVTGDSKPYRLTLEVNEEPILGGIPDNAVIKAQIKDITKKKILTADAITITKDVPGSNWALSKIVVKFPRTATKDIVVTGKEGFMEAYLEIQIHYPTDDSDWTWEKVIEIHKGIID